MKLKFSSDQQYQLKAIDSIVDILKGQEYALGEFTAESYEVAGSQHTDFGYANRITIAPDTMVGNLHTVQLENGLPRTRDLEAGQLRDFTVEMETGTGKTYVYTRSIFELNKRYGLTKFIIVVPSIAIREGVYKSLQVTKEHFAELYDSTPCEFFIYDSKKLGEVRSFATSSTIQIMILNIQAFQKDTNIMNQPREQMNGYRPIDFISRCNPVVIIDEPQSVDGTKLAKDAIASLEPAMVLRYSATHKEKKNMVYRLTPVDAYNQGLVKQIRVDSIRSHGDFNNPYIKLEGVSKDKVRLTLDIAKRSAKSGSTVSRTTVTAKVGDDLWDFSGERDMYRGWVISGFDATPGWEKVEFDNGFEVALGVTSGDHSELAIKRAQIASTIETHLEMERRLIPQGIKVLSLFFIDKVENYRVYDDTADDRGVYAKIFEEEYARLIQLPKNRTLFNGTYELEENPTLVHDGYFAKDKERLKDSKNGESKADGDAFNLIMKDKERLLSFDTKLRFIFSHSALKEGWDNPNVFQVCTLVDTGTSFTKRQKVGRGLRLCVNQDGERVLDSSTNMLTVIADESYSEFADTLQKEIEDECGIKFGTLRAESFADARVVAEDGVVSPLGVDVSARVFTELKAAGLIDKHGKIQEELVRVVDAGNLVLPIEAEGARAEIEAIIKRASLKIPIRNAANETTQKLNKGVFLSPDFIALWDQIKAKTQYSIEIDIDNFVGECVRDIREKMSVIKAPKIMRNRGLVTMDTAGVVAEDAGIYEMTDIAATYDKPNPLTALQDVVGLTRRTICRILIESGRLAEYSVNPQAYLEAVAKIIISHKQRQMVDGIKYTKLGETDVYALEIFNDSELERLFLDQVVESKRSVYEYVVCDSKIEMAFAEKLECDQEVKLYAKLPARFTVDTPLGSYNPDWAILVEKGGTEKLYFVIETKGSTNQMDLRPIEDGKIRCAQKHFEAINTDARYEKASSYEEWKVRV